MAKKAKRKGITGAAGFPRPAAAKPAAAKPEKVKAPGALVYREIKLPKKIAVALDKGIAGAAKSFKGTQAEFDAWAQRQIVSAEDQHGEQ